MHGTSCVLRAAQTCPERLAAASLCRSINHELKVVLTSQNQTPAGRAGGAMKEKMVPGRTALETTLQLHTIHPHSLSHKSSYQPLCILGLLRLVRSTSLLPVRLHRMTTAPQKVCVCACARLEEEREEDEDEKTDEDEEEEEQQDHDPERECCASE